MGVSSSREDVVAAALPPGFLDYKGRDLRDELDSCLGSNMWYFTGAGIAISVPVCLRYKTERPMFAAAIVCPTLDMMYGTMKCEPQKRAFVAHCKQLQDHYERERQRALAMYDPGGGIGGASGASSSSGSSSSGGSGGGGTPWQRGSFGDRSSSSSSNGGGGGGSGGGGGGGGGGDTGDGLPPEQTGPKGTPAGKRGWW